MTAPTTADARKPGALTPPQSPANTPATIDTARTGLRMLRPIAEPALILETQELTRRLIQETLKKGRDYGEVPGIERSTLLKPGAERIALSFGCKYGPPEIVQMEVDHDRIVQWSKRKKEWYGPKGARKYNWKEESGTSRGLYRYVIRRDVIEIETGRVVGHGIGSCSTMESKYVDRPRDSENTALKMGSKRAMLDACLTTFGLSDQFTQDAEDMPAGEDHDERDRGHADDVKLEPITADTLWPSGQMAGKAIKDLDLAFLLWANAAGRKLGPRTAEWQAVVAAVLSQREKCAKLGCEPTGKWHDESCPLFVEIESAQPGETKPAADVGDTGNSAEPGEPGESVNR